MDQSTLIFTIEKASKFEDVLSPTEFKPEYLSIISQIHPDKCNLAGASDATAKMIAWKDYYENGKEYKDDAGTFKTNGYWVEFFSSQPNLKWSIDNYLILSRMKGGNHAHFQKYIPYKTFTPSLKTAFDFEHRAIPLVGLTLPQEHVNWILNRLLEYCAYLSEIGMSHCGLTPESVFIVPENHGIQICSFYHMTKFGNKIGTISGKYKNWYPAATFHDKTANATIDIEMAKKLAIYLLGDPSGTGIKLRKTHNPDFVNFVVSQSTNAYQALTEYKELLKKNFEKKFHLLTL